jgi:hypothetical protein
MVNRWAAGGLAYPAVTVSKALEARSGEAVWLSCTVAKLVLPESSSLLKTADSKPLILIVYAVA